MRYPPREPSRNEVNDLFRRGRVVGQEGRGMSEEERQQIVKEAMYKGFWNGMDSLAYPWSQRRGYFSYE